MVVDVHLMMISVYEEIRYVSESFGGPLTQANIYRDA